MKMDPRVLVLTLLPFSVFCFDIYDFFSTPPPKSSNSLVFHHPHSANLNQTFAAKLNQTHTANLNQTLGGADLNQTQSGNLNQTQTANASDTILIEFSSLCSYRGTAMSIKLLVLENFPGINVTLSHHPPDLTKYLTTKFISTAQVLIIIIVMAGGYILAEMRMPIPPWYHRLAAHKFFVIAIPWLLGSIAINYLQNTEPFEVYFNDELAFCKLQAGWFPGATEVKELIRSRLAG